MLTAPPLNPCASFTTTTTHHHHHQHLSISKRFNLLLQVQVSAKFQRKKNNRYQQLSPHNYDADADDDEEKEEESEGEIGGIGNVLMKSLKSDTPPRTIDAIQKNPKPTSSHLSATNSKEEEEKGRVTELNGMDVLIALQRAKSQTRSKTTTRRRKKGSLDMKRGSGHDDDDDDDSIMDYKNVKPLNVKSDWGTRLDECEKTLQQLLLHQKF